MNIAIVIPGKLPVPPVNGGAVETLIYTIIKENELDSSPMNIDVYGIEDDFSNSYKLNEKYTKYNFIKKEKIIFKNKIFIKIKNRLCNKLKYSYFLNKTIDLIQNKKYEYIIIENRPNYVMKIKQNNNSKIILHMHNEHLTNYINYQKVVDACYKIIVVSKYIKDTIVKSYTVDDEKIMVVHNGIDVKRFNKFSEDDREIIRKKYNISQNDFVVIFSGRLTKEKGIMQLINAIIKCGEINTIKLLVVGSSWFANSQQDEFSIKLKERANLIPNKVIFTGYINYAEIANVYNIADIAVLPSIWNDPFPLTVLECMSIELPIISTESGGIPEMVNDKCGILLPIDINIEENLAKSIKYLFNEPSKRETMGCESRKRAENNFSNKEFYNRFINVLVDEKNKDDRNEECEN